MQTMTAYNDGSRFGLQQTKREILPVDFCCRSAPR